MAISFPLGDGFTVLKNYLVLNYYQIITITVAINNTETSSMVVQWFVCSCMHVCQCVISQPRNPESEELARTNELFTDTGKQLLYHKQY